MFFPKHSLKSYIINAMVTENALTIIRIAFIL